MTLKERLSNIIKDGTDNTDDYTILCDALTVLDVVARICSDDTTYVEPNFGYEDGKLYIDGCTSYESTVEKITVINWLKQLRGNYEE